MKPRHVAVSLILLSCALLACTFAGSAAPSPNTAPTPPGTSTEATLPPLAPGTLIPTRLPPTATSGDHHHAQRHTHYYGDSNPDTDQHTAAARLNRAAGFHHQHQSAVGLIPRVKAASS